MNIPEVLARGSNANMRKDSYSADIRYIDTDHSALIKAILSVDPFRTSLSMPSFNFVSLRFRWRSLHSATIPASRCLAWTFFKNILYIKSMSFNNRLIGNVTSQLSSCLYYRTFFSQSYGYMVTLQSTFGKARLLKLAIPCTQEWIPVYR